MAGDLHPVIGKVDVSFINYKNHIAKSHFLGLRMGSRGSHTSVHIAKIAKYQRLTGFKTNPTNGKKKKKKEKETKLKILFIHINFSKFLQLQKLIAIFSNA